jgi:hypothetical protein
MIIEPISSALRPSPKVRFRHLVLFAAVAACCLTMGRSIADETYDPTVSRLAVMSDENAAVCAESYDDLGDFVVTYEMRVIDEVDTPGQYFQYGRFQIARRGDWVSSTLSLQQPMQADDGRMEAPSIEQTWIFHDGECEGFIENSGLTVDPNGRVGPDRAVVLPLYLGLGMVATFDAATQEYKLLTGTEAQTLLRSGQTDDVIEASEQELLVKSREFATVTPRGSWGGVSSYSREGKALDNDRKLSYSEAGFRFRLADGSTTDVPTNICRVNRWVGKLPADIVVQYFDRPVMDFESIEIARAGLEGAAEPEHLFGRREKEVVLSLLNLRTATIEDTVSMADWAPKVTMIRFNDHSNPAQDVRTLDSDTGTFSDVWKVDPVSQRWMLAE